MRFEVKYPTGVRHDVELKGTMAILGRDPSCDLVLNDVKCSRRHAAIELDARGLLIRDSGSANGVFVNGKKVERRHLNAGDIVRLGDVQLTVLEGEAAGTVVMAPEEISKIEKEAAPPARLPKPRPLQAQKTKTDEGATFAPAGPIPRPTTVTALAVLWALAASVFGLGGVVAIVGLGLSGPIAGAAAGGGLFLAALSALMALGLWSRAPWARVLQIGLAGLGIFVCPLTLPAATTLVYMLRPETHIRFSGRRDFRDLAPTEARSLLAPSADATFAFAIVGTLVVSLALTAVASWVWLRSHP